MARFQCATLTRRETTADWMRYVGYNKTWVATASKRLDKNLAFRQNSWTLIVCKCHLLNLLRNSSISRWTWNRPCRNPKWWWNTDSKNSVKLSRRSWKWSNPTRCALTFIRFRKRHTQHHSLTNRGSWFRALPKIESPNRNSSTNFWDPTNTQTYHPKIFTISCRRASLWRKNEIIFTFCKI